MKTKTCFKCGRTLPISEFYTHSQMSDGHLNKCKDCTRRDVKQYRSANPRAELASRLKACRKNPTHKNANMAVDAALRAGVMVRPSVCQGCGRSASETRLSAHHHDYLKPLDVIWLCAACHRPVDKVRSFVESGATWDAWSKQNLKRKNRIKHALEYYKQHARVQNVEAIDEVLRDLDSFDSEEAT